MERLKGVTVFKNTEAEETTDAQKTQETDKFDGFYFVNNLGRLSAAPQVLTDWQS